MQFIKHCTTYHTHMCVQEKQKIQFNLNLHVVGTLTIEVVHKQKDSQKIFKSHLKRLRSTHYSYILQQPGFENTSQHQYMTCLILNMYDKNTFQSCLVLILGIQQYVIYCLLFQSWIYSVISDGHQSRVKSSDIGGDLMGKMMLCQVIHSHLILDRKST